MKNNFPWQLKMFQKTLKKKLRLKALKKHLSNLSENDRCLLVTCGDNNGAINYYLKELGGNWSWAEFKDRSSREMSELLQSPVHHATEDKLPFPDNAFDCVISIDVHEHIDNPDMFTRELSRVTELEGLVIITVPNGDETKLATRIKHLVGMTKHKYGHVRQGFDIPELKELMRSNGIEPFEESSFSKFFTELLELSINFLYINILAKGSKAETDEGTIAPVTRDQLKAVEKTFKLYSLIYPVFRVISMMDVIFWYSTGYAVIVEGRRK